MSFCFVHAADLHLGSPLRGLAMPDAATRALFANATREAFRNLVTRTIEAEAAFLVVAGDVFDGDWRDYATGLFFTRELARLSRAGIPVFLLSGNHDADGEITRHLQHPEGVRTFSTRKVETFELPELRVRLHGRGFPQRALTENVVPDYPEARAGWLDIGVLHTSLDGREGHAAYAPATPADLAAKGYGYWALGHVHAFEAVAQDPWIVFPGVLQGRHARETGAKGAVLVTVDDRLRVDAVDRLVVDVARWDVARIDITGADDLAAVVARVEAAARAAAAAADGRPLALRIHVVGVGAAHAQLAGLREPFDAEVRNAAARVSERISIEKIVLASRPPARAAGPPVDRLADPDALFAETLADPDFGAKVADAVSALRSRLPGECTMPATDDILAEARALLLGRLGAGAQP